MIRKNEVLTGKTEDELIKLCQKKKAIAWMYAAGALIGSLVLAFFAELLLARLRTDYETIMTSPLWRGICWVAVGLDIVDIICLGLAAYYKLSADKILRHLRDLALTEVHNSTSTKQ